MRRIVILSLSLVLSALLIPAGLRAAEEEAAPEPQQRKGSRLGQALERIEKRLGALEKRFAKLEKQLERKDGDAARDVARRLRELAEELEGRAGPEERPRPRIRTFRWPPREGEGEREGLPPEMREMFPRLWREFEGREGRALAGRRVWLGVSVQEIGEGTAKVLGLEKAEGALVNAVTPGSPAERAGVEPGDVILRFGEQEIRGPDDLVAAVRERKPGDEVEVRLVRKGGKRKVAVTLAAPPGAKPPPPPPPPREEDVF